jgi:hypothetical protein
MNKNVEAMIEGFSERMKHIGMFAPILRVEQPKKFNNLPVPTIALYVLLYMLENKLSLNQNTTREELQFEMWEVVKHNWDALFTLAEAKELEEWLVTKHLRNQGKAHEFTFFDFEKQKERTYGFHLIEYGEGTNVFGDRNEESDDFRLTSIGLELLFKTKEVFGELRITMSQLFFKRQFEKGLFTDALRRIHEMHTLIEDEKKQIQKLQTHIIKDALGVAQREELEKMLQRIDETLKTEKGQFHELQLLVEEKIDEYHEGRLTEKEQEGIHIIQDIEGKLLQAISLHESLFTEKQKTQNVMSESLESSIIHAFSVHLDFDQEILQSLIEVPVNEEVLNHISRPLLPLNHHKVFNPFLSLIPQNRYKRKESKEEDIIKIDEELKRQQEEAEARRKEEQEEREYEYLSVLLTPLANQEYIYLSDLIRELRSANTNLYDHIMYNPDPFLGFIAELHQSEYNEFKQVSSNVWKNLPDDKKTNRMLTRLTNEHPDLEAVGHFSLLETNNYHYVGTMRYRDIKFVRGDCYGMDARSHREGV